MVLGLLLCKKSLESFSEREGNHIYYCYHKIEDTLSNQKAIRKSLRLDTISIIISNHTLYFTHKPTR